MKQRLLSVWIMVVLIVNMLLPAQSINAASTVGTKEMVGAATERKAGLKAEYFLLDRADLILEEKTGEQIEENINYPMGNGGPLGTVLKNQTGRNTHAGIRWTGKLIVPETANYTFYTISDDGSKLWLDGKEMTDYWKVSWEEEQTSEPVYLEAGKEYDFRFDYMQWEGGQCAAVSWKNDAGIGTKTVIPKTAFFQPDAVTEEPEVLATERYGLQGDYYKLKASGQTGKLDVPVFGDLMATSIDSNIMFGDMENILENLTGVKDKAGVRWRSNLVAPAAGYYTFHVYSDNGAKITLDKKQILTWWEKKWDVWQTSTEVFLEAGEAVPFKLDYFEWDGGSHVNLYWSYRANKTDPAGERQAIPDEVFRLPNSYSGMTTEKIDTIKAVLNVDEGLDGTIDILGSGFDKAAVPKVEIVNSSGMSLFERTMANIVEVTANKITIEVPEKLRVGKYRLRVTAGNVVVVTNGAEGIFAVITTNKDSNDRPEYPNPEWSRQQDATDGKNWMSLNGWWEFEFDKNEVGQTEAWYSTSSAKEFSREINVPFCWESAYSGITDTSYRGQAWYKRQVTLNSSDWAGKRLVLKFGAVDWKCKLWVNGSEVGSHEGGYTAFEMDITDYVNLDAENTIALWVEDKSSYGDNSYPALVGKQGWNAPCGYTHTSGIWQSVYLEGRQSEKSLEYAHANPDIDKSEVTFDIKAANASGESIIVAYDFNSILYDKESGQDVKTGSEFAGEQTVTLDADGLATLAPIQIPDQKLWNYNEANLYDGKITLKSSDGTILDQVSTYFGQRKISTEFYTDSVGAKYIYVNNHPVYFAGLLDQGYWGEGTYTAPSADALKYDIAQMKGLGFNMIRKHLKIEDPIQYYWTDRLGMFVWQDMPHATAMCPTGEGALTPGRVCYEYALENMLNKEYNHPSIVAVMLFNETWGLQEAYFNNKQNVIAQDGLNTLDWVQAMYNKTKQINPNILVEDMSPCNYDHIQPSDMNTWHMYPKGYTSSKNTVEDFVKNAYTGSGHNYKFGYKNDGDPFLNSEYGGVAAYDGDWDVSWCFKYQTDIQRQYDKLSGFVYTEPYDVEYERNGFMTYDRKHKVFGYDEVAYGGDMGVKDLVQETYIGLDVDPARVMKPNAQYSAPVITMRWSPEALEGQYTVKWRFDATDIFGNSISTATKGSFPIALQAYTRESREIKFKLPAEECVGTITTWIEDPAGKSIAKNFVNVIVSDGKTLAGEQVIDENSRVLRAEVADNQQVNKTGKESFTYVLPEDYDLTQLSSLRILAEASSVKGATSNNSANAQTTVGHELASDVTVSVNGVEIRTVVLPDNPRDIRGTLTLPKGLNGGSSAGNFGYLLNLCATKEQLSAIKATLQDSKDIVVSYEVREDAKNPNGVRIYGDQEGRYALNPTLLLNPQDIVLEDITVSNQEKQLAVMESDNYSIEGVIDGKDAGFLVRDNGTGGYYIGLQDNGTRLILTTRDGKVLGTKEGLSAGAHPVKVTLFDDHIKVYADHNPQQVIDVYDYSGFTGGAAVKASGSASFTNLCLSPESYAKDSLISGGQVSVNYVDHFNTESTFKGRYQNMGNNLTAETSDGVLKMTADMGDKLILKNLEAADVVLEADVSVTSTPADGNLGFVFRATDFTIGADGAKGYYAGLGNQNGKAFLQLGRMDGGSWTQLGKAALGEEVLGTVHRLKITAIDSRICIYIDDEETPRLDVYDSHYANGGFALRGFRAGGTFDNVVISTAPRYQTDFEQNRIDEWQTTGEWSLENGSLTGKETGSAAVVGNTSWSDYQYSATVKMGTGAIAGLLVRAEITGNQYTGYKVLLDEAKDKVSFVLCKKGEKDKVLVSRNYDLKADTQYKVTIRAVNNSFQVVMEGKRVIEAKSNVIGQGKAGFICVTDNVVYDNVTIGEKYIYNENFAPGSLSGWDIIEGDFSVNDNTLLIPQGKGLKMVDGYATWDNYVLSAKIKLAAKDNLKSNVGFVFRASDFSAGADNQRGYVAGINYHSNPPAAADASGVELGDLRYGWRQIQNQMQEIENDHWYNFEVKVNDHTITVSLDGEVCYEVTDDAYSYGMFGIRNFQTAAYMKDLSIVPYELYGVVEEPMDEEEPEEEEPGEEEQNGEQPPVGLPTPVQPGTGEVPSKVDVIKTEISGIPVSATFRNGVFYGSGNKKLTSAVVQVDSGERYIVNETGKKYVSAIVEMQGGLKYIVDDGGVIVTGTIIATNNERYYAAKDSGAIVTDKLFKWNGNKYYAGESGALIRGDIVTVKGSLYYTTKATGKVVTGKLFKFDGKRYIAEKSGKLVTSKWKTVNKQKYYCSETGAITKRK